jgi:hypothetical protein
MSSNGDTHLASLRADAAETRTLFSNPMKPERERMVVRAYFNEDEIASSNEPAPAPAVTDELSRQGWRSVALLAVPHGAVLMASTNAPKCLKTKSGLIL